MNIHLVQSHISMIMTFKRSSFTYNTHFWFHVNSIVYIHNKFSFSRFFKTQNYWYEIQTNNFVAMYHTAYNRTFRIRTLDDTPKLHEKRVKRADQWSFKCWAKFKSVLNDLMQNPHWRLFNLKCWKIIHTSWVVFTSRKSCI